MKADGLHDYEQMPEEEIENSKEILNRADNYKLIDVIRKPEQNLGLDERVNVALIIYEHVE